MLSMLLLMAVAPQAAETPRPSLRPASVLEMIEAGVLPPMPTPDSAARMPGLSNTGSGCESDVRLANDASAGNGLAWREGDEPVGLYRLLDRRVNGCPAPIIVRYRVPGSNAIGRESGGAPAAPVIGPRR